MIKNSLNHNVESLFYLLKDPKDLIPMYDCIQVHFLIANQNNIEFWNRETRTWW